MQSYSRRMNELDEVWSQMMREAIGNARGSGRHDVADYLTLKASNDAIRTAAVKWLFDSLIEIAGQANRENSAISIEREEPHNFSHHGSNMVGSLLRVRQGVRCITLEAGWTRTPGDGFMRGGALAFARITHFGDAGSNTELILIGKKDRPQWFAAVENKAGDPFTSDDILRHFRTLLGT